MITVQFKEQALIACQNVEDAVARLRDAINTELPHARILDHTNEVRRWLSHVDGNLLRDHNHQEQLRSPVPGRYWSGPQGGFKS